MSAEVEMLNEELYRKRNHIKLLNAQLQKNEAVLRQALEALEWSIPKEGASITNEEAITAIKEALK